MEDVLLKWRQVSRYFEDSSVDEILVNGDLGTTVVAGLRRWQDRSPFETSGQMMAWLLSFARRQGVRLDPLVGAAGGQISAEFCQVVSTGEELFRWHAVLPPLSQDGAYMSVRRHRFGRLLLRDFAGSTDLKARLTATMSERRSMIFAGPTGSGKSTMMLALLAEYASAERVVIIESVAEIPRLFPGWIRLLERSPNLEGVGAVSTERLLKETLRLRPDRIVVGEIRGSEARTFFTAMACGHDGSLATLHAGSAEEARFRLLSLAAPGGKAQRAVSSAGDSRFTRLEVVMMARGEPPMISAVESIYI